MSNFHAIQSITTKKARHMASKKISEMIKEKTGETDLTTLLKSMRPKLVDEQYVFISINNAKYGDGLELNPIGMFMEEEGMTLVVPKQSAIEHRHSFDSIFKCITLTIHSSLDAVGLTAAFANKLKAHNISANVIAGFYHDHIFVQAEKAEQAIIALKEFSQ